MIINLHNDRDTFFLWTDEETGSGKEACLRLQRSGHPQLRAPFILSESYLYHEKFLSSSLQPGEGDEDKPNNYN